MIDILPLSLFFCFLFWASNKFLYFDFLKNKPNAPFRLLSISHSFVASSTIELGAIKCPFINHIFFVHLSIPSCSKYFFGVTPCLNPFISLFSDDFHYLLNRNQKFGRGNCFPTRHFFSISKKIILAFTLVTTNLF